MTDGLHSNESDGVSGNQPVTPVSGGVGNSTPATSGVNDGGSQDRVRELEGKLQQREQDLNKLKSSLQSSFEKERQQWNAQWQQTQKEINELRMSKMTDEEKVQYQRTLENEEATKWRQRAEELERQQYETQVANNYVSFFRDLGVDTSKIDNSQGLDGIVNSGWQQVKALIDDLRSKANTGTQQAPTQQPQQANQRSPLPASPNSQPPGNTWADIKQKYGSLEDFFGRLERGEISPNEIPK